MSFFSSISDLVGQVIRAVQGCFPNTPPAPSTPCPPKAIRGRFERDEVKCGDRIGLEATATNIADGTTASFALRSLPGRGGVTTLTAPLSGSRVNASSLRWVSKKPATGSPRPEMDFEVSADGVSDTSGNQLNFHQYANQAGETKTIACSSPPFGWTGKFDLEFSAGEVIVTVKVKLLNRLGAKPANSGDPLPEIGDPVTAEDKQAMKEDIEGKLTRKWVIHRDNCQRDAACDCPNDRRCCKFRVRIRVQFVESGEHHQVNLFQGAGRANATNWTRVKTRDNSWAHETGHLLAWYDEYTGGAVGAAPRWENPRAGAVMNTGLTVPAEYYWDFRDWFGGKFSEPWELVSP
jgi:hypothetical protein